MTKNEAALAKMRLGVVVKDCLGLGAVFVQSHLHKKFPFQNWQWLVRSIPEGLFLIDPPTEEWRRFVLQNKVLILGDVEFPVEAYNPLKFDGGREPEKVWVIVKGLPFHMWKDF